MQIVAMTQEQFDAIMSELKAMREQLRNQKANIIENQIENIEFCKLLKISKRTAQTWRDEGLVSFTQINGKIYYDLTDVEAFFQAYKVDIQASQLRHRRSQYGKNKFHSNPS
jgi:GTPase involved in cell partitioning and DNA repair